MKPTSFTDPIHIVHGAGAGGTVYQSAKKPRPDVIVLMDCLTLGPCAADPDWHGQCRGAYWHAQEETDQPRRRKKQPPYVYDRDQFSIISVQGLAAFLEKYPADRPVMIWSTPTLSDRLTLWWLLDALNCLKLDRRRFWLCQPRPAVDPGEDVWTLGLACWPVEWFRRGFADAQLLSTRMLQGGAFLWRSFAGPSPIRFRQSCLKRDRLFPEVTKLLALYSLFFPKLARKNSTFVRLSSLDQFLLGNLSTNKWRRPYDIFMADQEEFIFLMGLINSDFWLRRRLFDWTEHQKLDPILLTRPENRGVSPFTTISYRLTSRGQEIQQRGMNNLSAAPLWEIGGCKIYDPERPWVSFDDNVILMERINRVPFLSHLATCHRNEVSLSDQLRQRHGVALAFFGS
jgi:hypothetical protein